MASIGLLGLIASSADAKGSKRPKQPPLKNIATTANPKCDVKNIKFLEGMIKKRQCGKAPEEGSRLCPLSIQHCQTGSR